MFMFFLRSILVSALTAMILTTIAAFVGWIVTGNHVGAEFAIRMWVSAFVVFFGIDMITLIAFVFRDKSERLDT